MSDWNDRNWCICRTKLRDSPDCSRRRGYLGPHRRADSKVYRAEVRDHAVVLNDPTDLGVLRRDCNVNFKVATATERMRSDGGGQSEHNYD